MRISRFSRRFHDPWGNDFGNRYGSPIRFQYMASYAALIDSDMGGVDDRRKMIDRSASFESTGNKFVKAAKRSIERLRR